jgi:DNA helicase-2/ATP-dependent DNA helicase PcrA
MVYTLQGTSPADLIRRLLDLIGYENHLKTTQPDWESRWENVQELITFASEVEVDAKAVDQHISGDVVKDEEVIDESR